MRASMVDVFQTQGTQTSAEYGNFMEADAWSMGAIHGFKIELSLSCRGVIDGDLLTKSDPMIVMYLQSPISKIWREVGRTETVYNTLNADFVRKFVVDYYFEELQRLKFEVYDVDSKSDDLKKHTYLGRCFCLLGQIVRAKPRYHATLSIEGKPDRGTVIIAAEELTPFKESVYMEWSARKLDRKDIFGKSDPFMVISRQNVDRTYTICHKTEVIKNTLNPKWRPTEIPVSTLCNADYGRNLKVEIFDWNRGGKHSMIGTFSTTLKDLTESDGERIFRCMNPKKRLQKGYLHSGEVCLKTCRLENRPSFVDFIKSGTEMNFVVAIDLSSSNGSPDSNTSLHHNDPNKPNYYHQAIKAVGEVIQHYDTDGLFPAYGFGAEPQASNTSCGFFPLNFDSSNDRCHTIQGVLDAYQNCLTKIKQIEPTNFAPIVKELSRLATNTQDASKYYVLLLLTDGGISDLDETKEAILHASKLPVSLVIVGVGDQDFSAMHELDGDAKKLKHRGIPVDRDIVQFIPFHDFLSREMDHVANPEKLAKEILAEIPDQLVDYMKKKNYNPMR